MEQGTVTQLRPDVVLVCMPFVGVQRPNLALGLLKAILAQGGIRASVVNAYLHYLECIGPEDYLFLTRMVPHDAVVDWIFAEEAFPGQVSSPETFIDALFANTAEATRLMPRADWFRMLHSLRGTAKVFLEWMTSMVLRQNPRIVGCTSTFEQHVASLALLRRIREARPDIVTIMGGANLETVMGRATHQRFPWVDVVVSGEADDVVVPLFRDLLTRGAAIPAAEAPFGVLVPAHRTEGYPTVQGGDGVPRRSVKSLQGLPAPDYDEYFQDLRRSPYHHLIDPTMPVEFSRGCWWGERSHCTFCGLNGGTMDYRCREPGEAEAIFAELAERYQLKTFEVVDNILSMGYFETLLASPAFQDAGYNIFFETKSNIREHHVKALARAGTRMVQPGIESLDSRVLKLMRKGVTAAANIRLMRLCAEYGIRTGWAVLSDFPGEEDSWYADMAKIVPLLTHLRAGPLIRLRYDRFSPYHREAAERGLTLRPAFGYQHVYPADGTDVTDHAYFFDLEGEPCGGRSVIWVERPDRPGLEALRLAMLEWNRLWRETPPRCEMFLTKDGPVVADTRPGFAWGETPLTPDQYAVLLACRDSVPERTLATGADVVASLPPGPNRDAVVAELERRGWLARLDGQMLTVPINRNVERHYRPYVAPDGLFRAEASEQLRLAWS